MKLSVIVPTRNRVESLTEVLNELLKMSGNFEIIVVNDASSDKTDEVIKKKFDKKIQYLKNDKQMGALESCLRGIKISNGEYITFIADDDRYINYNFFEFALKYSDDIICAKYETVLNGKIVKNDFECNSEILTTEEALKIFNQFSHGGNTIFKKDLIYNIYSYNLKHDFSIIFLSLVYAKSIRFINNVVFHWYLDLDKKSFSSSILNSPYDLLKWDEKFLDEIVPILKEKELYKKYKWFVDNTIFNIFENIEFNYYLTNRKKFFNRLLTNINKEVYIYGYGQTGVLLKEFLEKNDVKVLGFIDDFKEKTLKINKVDKSKKIIIATFKSSLIHKMYKKLIENGINYKNIEVLI